MESLLYPTRVARRICRVTDRMLGYWIAQKVITPSGVYRAHPKGRDLFLFSFEDLLRIKIVRSLRATGVSLQRISIAIRRLQALGQSAWHREWLATDGKRVLRMQNNSTLEVLSGPQQGQLAFAVVALSEHRKLVIKAVASAKPFDHVNLRGKVRRFAHE